ncbi:hypothetical protein EZS27_034010, partial [termite gut metagenome]
RSEILLEGLSAGVGLGYSKKESQQNAAHIALKKIKTSHDFVLSILETKEQKDLQEEEPSIEQQPEMEICTEEELL